MMDSERQWFWNRDTIPKEPRRTVNLLAYAWPPPNDPQKLEACLLLLRVRPEGHA